MDKSTLRKMIRDRKKAMTKEDIQQASERLMHLFLASDHYKNCNSLYGYLPYNQEVRTVPILEHALKDGKRVAVPKVFGDTMKFIWIDDLSAVESGFSGIPEPIADGPVADDKTALVLMPGLAFDAKGHRIGYGGGFYDRFLEEEPSHPTVALCYDFQLLDYVETESFDKLVDCVLWA